VRKPPLGLIPKHIRQAARLEEVAAAIRRYHEAGEPVPHAWYDEEAELRYLLAARSLDRSESRVGWERTPGSDRGRLEGQACTGSSASLP